MLHYDDGPISRLAVAIYIYGSLVFFLFLFWEPPFKAIYSKFWRTASDCTRAVKKAGITSKDSTLNPLTRASLAHHAHTGTTTGPCLVSTRAYRHHNWSLHYGTFFLTHYKRRRLHTHTFTPMHMHTHTYPAPMSTFKILSWHIILRLMKSPHDGNVSSHWRTSPEGLK